MAGMYIRKPSVTAGINKFSLLSVNIGGKGQREGQFNNCCSVTTLGNGEIAVADVNNKRVQIIDNIGNIVTVAGVKKLRCPWAVAAASDGKFFFCSDGERSRIVVYDNKGEYIKHFSTVGQKEPCSIASCPVLKHIAVTNYNDTNIVIYNADSGDVVTSFKPTIQTIKTPYDLYDNDDNDHLHPEYMAFDTKGHLHVSFGSSSSTVHVFDVQTQEPLFTYGSFQNAAGIHITAKNNILVADRERRTVSMYNAEGLFLKQLVNEGLGMFTYPHDLTVVNGSTIVVTASDDPFGVPDRVQFYNIA